ncbi:hypothetical protein HPB51_000804 [Rhipicephalus microplus]|uniref:Uncharacterized protein n=1 Tax=Rhipicephalus microplus TaxID=6941 RepID=A0A9J6EK27_RHIMP|nr:hypothetical protein HPB51_000804 [Rhipicephalus microplus]
MARSLQVTTQRIAEKLTILNDRGVGMLTRIYNIKKACGDAKSKPSFLSDKNLESAIKHVVRRFPNIDIRGNSAQLSAVFNIRQDIMKSLSLYYYTFVDLLDFRDHVNELLTTIDSFQLHLDITLNFDVTKAYLDLVAAYVTLMILLSRVEDRKAVLGLFNTAHEMTHGHSDNSFPRLGQLIIEYDPPLKKLADEFVPHSKTLFQALMSLQQVFPRRNLTADEWRKSQMLSLLVTPAQMLTPAQTETVGAGSESAGDANDSASDQKQGRWPTGLRKIGGNVKTRASLCPHDLRRQRSFGALDLLYAIACRRQELSQVVPRPWTPVTVFPSFLSLLSPRYVLARWPSASLFLYTFTSILLFLLHPHPLEPGVVADLYCGSTPGRRDTARGSGRRSLARGMSSTAGSLLHIVSVAGQECGREVGRWRCLVPAQLPAVRRPREYWSQLEDVSALATVRRTEGNVAVAGPQPPAQALFLQALSNGWALTLFRDELLAVHPYAQQFFEGLKGHGKRASEVKEALGQAVQSAPLVHRERRKFLRSALKELALVLAEQPGLLGPKALYVLMGLSLARDEVCWLVRHNELGPPSRAPGRSRSLQGEDLLDRQLPELLFHMEELRGLFRKYSQVVQLYYVQYLNGFDAPALEAALQGIPGIPEEDCSIAFRQACSQARALTAPINTDSPPPDLRGLRLDWCRLPAARVRATPLRGACGRGRT